MKWWNRRRRWRKWNGETLGGGEGSFSVKEWLLRIYWEFSLTFSFIVSSFLTVKDHWFWDSLDWEFKFVKNVRIPLSFPLPAERLDRESFFFHFIQSSFYAFFVPSHSELRLDMESIGPKWWQPLSHTTNCVGGDHHPFILALLHSLLRRQPTTRGFRCKMDSFLFAWPDREQLQPRGSPTLPTAFALRSDLGLDPERRSRVPCHVFC